MNFIITILILLLILSIIVIVHEFGHFITAKKSGVYVDEFSFGMGPLIFHHKPKKSETTYSVRAFPIGGYVSMAEKEDKENKVDSKRILSNKTFTQKFLILIMGIVMNFVLAFVMFFVSGLIYGKPVNEPIIGGVIEGSASYVAGLESGDRILTINGEKINDWDDILLEISAKKLMDNYEFVVLKNDGTTKTYNFLPSVTYDEEGNEKRVFGISMSATTYEKGFVSALEYSYSGTVSTFKTIIKVLVSLFNGSVSTDSVSGVVGMYGIVDDLKGAGLEPILYLIAYLSVNVAVINLIPIPVFDGGRILLIIIEKVTGKKTNEKLELILNYVGFGIMILLTVLVTLNDIIKLF